MHVTMGEIQIWSNSDGRIGTVYYRISGALKPCTKQTLVAVITDVTQLINSDGSRCIEFQETDGRPNKNMQAYIDFQQAFDSCEYQRNTPGMPFDPLSSTAKVSIKIKDKCVSRSALVYNLARILGLPDEHTRDDRDNYINIHWNNIETEAINRKIYNESSSKIGDMPYDFTSVTHVGPFEHALDTRKPTLSSKYEGVHFGDHLNLSVIDVIKIRQMYNCPTDINLQSSMAYRPIHCTFDLPLCGLVNDWTSPGIQWTKKKGPVSEEGPQTDHTNGDGWYMFANETESFNTARLVSITEVSPGDVCVSLYYYLENNSTTVKIFQKESVRNTVKQIREINRNKEISWSVFRFSVTSPNTWRLLIEADVTNGAVAVDDVMVQYGRCPSLNECNNH
ncbi:meprin A subunit beta-like [Saccostrea echinata]|uniref:meprin A subunit beta-like n=1 Tax=Saccostrea echinata TaxID=191078 RepID=UPI002A815C8C|nr:meprin A subunit beta-like [Saccostrea echinata]